jgi:O-acetyl-ADP-ribose deacetylase (regulator of RNase III)
MIKEIIKDGDIFTSKAKVLVNPVNCVGVMGGGLALTFKNKYPEMFKEYKEICNNFDIHPGDVVYWYSDDKFESYEVLLFPTKDHYRNPSEIEYIVDGLIDLCNNYKKWNISSIAFPKIGCGLGGLNWEDVKPLIINKLKDLDDLEVYIYE